MVLYFCEKSFSLPLKGTPIIGAAQHTLNIPAVKAKKAIKNIGHFTNVAMFIPSIISISLPQTPDLNL